MPRNAYEPLKTYYLKVNINCQGCKRKVKKTLRKVEGVYSVDIDTDEQAVMVRGNLDPEILIKKLNRRGKHAQLLFLSPYHQAGLNKYDNISWRNTQDNTGSNNINGFPVYEMHNLLNHQSEEEMMMANNMKPVMMSNGDYFQTENFFGEIPQRNNNYEEVNANMMRSMELGHSNTYPAAETMNMQLGGRIDNIMMNERGFNSQMMTGQSLIPQYMHQEQFSSRPLHGGYY